MDVGATDSVYLSVFPGVNDDMNGRFETFLCGGKSVAGASQISHV